MDKFIIFISDIFKRNKNYFIYFFLGLALLFLFFPLIEKIFLGLGGLFNCENIFFQFGYWMVFFIIICFYLNLIYKKYYSKPSINFTIFFICFFYVLIRFFSLGDMELITLPTDPKFPYLDILIGVFFLHCVLVISSFVKEFKLLIKEKKESFYIEDGPINCEFETDNEKIITNLLNTLKNFKPQSAFNIGLNADWGYGKTTFLNRFKYLKINQDKDAVVFWFRVWKNKGSDSLIENFFKELKTNLEPYSAEISNSIDKYVNAILNISNSDINKVLESGKQIFNQDETLEEYYYNINNIIRKIDKQIVILLDDLDRLESSEILNTFKLMRTLSDFNNIIFLTGYDRKYILKTLNLPKDNYIDKVFNVEINLLHFDEKRIYDYLINTIKKEYSNDFSFDDNSELLMAFRIVFTKNKIDLFFGLEDIPTSRNTIELNYNHFLTSYRDIKKFINEFKFSYSFIQNSTDIILSEYLLLRLLLYKYRDLYYDVFGNLKDFLEVGAIDESNSKIQYGIFSNNDVYVYTEDAQRRLDNYTSKYEVLDQQIIHSVFVRLFSEKEISLYSKHQNCIAKTYYTDIYLKNNLLGGRITISELTNALESNQMESLSKSFEDYSSETKDQLFNEFKNFIFNLDERRYNKEVYKDILKTSHIIFNSNSILTNKRFIDILKKWKEYFSNKKDLVNFIESIILKSNFGYIDKLLQEININQKRKERNDIYNSRNMIDYEFDTFNDNEIKNLLISKLKYVIDSFLPVSIILGAYHLYTEKIIGDHRIIRTKIANDLIKKDMISRFNIYYDEPIFEFSQRESGIQKEGATFSPYDFLSQIFSESKTLAKLNEKPLDSDIYEKFVTEGWANYLDFLKSYLENKNYKTKISKIVKLVELYISKSYKPLTFNEYNNIWSKED